MTTNYELTAAELEYGRLHYDAFHSLADDVHQTWRSTLQPGSDMPFEPDFVSVTERQGQESIDLANTEPQDLPPAMKALSVGTATVALSLLETYVETSPAELSSMRIEKMAIYLFSAWDVLKGGVREVETSVLTDRLDSFEEQSERVKMLDRRIILVSVATILDTERYPIWDKCHDSEKLRNIPGVEYYGQKGLKILDSVRGGAPLALKSDVDDLSERYRV